MLRKRSPGKKGRRSRFLRLNDRLPRPLSFDDEDRPPPRIGDLRPEEEVREEFPLAREREAGLTGGAIPGGGVTADDLSPETLLDDSLSRSPSARDDRDAVDTVLSDVSEKEIGAGLEDDLDEVPLAEQARRGGAGDSTRRRSLRPK